jgi:hypothetical protein
MYRLMLALVLLSTLGASIASAQGDSCDSRELRVCLITRIKTSQDGVGRKVGARSDGERVA